MVRKLIQFFNQEFGSLHKAALLLAVSSFASSLLAIFRDNMLASTFGAGRTLDVYYAAFKIPDFLYNVFLAIASAVVLIPLFLEKMEKTEEDAKRFINNIFSFFILAIAGISIVLLFLTPFIIKFFVPGFSLEDQKILINLTGLLLLSPIILGISNIVSSVIQSHNKFFIYALSPVFYNLGIIFGVAVLAPRYGIKGVAWGVIIGACMHLIIQLPSLIKLGFLPKLRFNIDFKEIRKVVKLSFPRTIGLCSTQFVLIFITSVASLLSAGSIAVFNLSYNLQSVPLTIIGLSFSVAAFPTLSRLLARNEKEKFLIHTYVALKEIIFWSLPAIIIFIVLRAQIVRVILGYGNFSWTDTRLTAAALAIFVVSIIAQSAILLFTRAFFAAGKTYKPVFANITGSLLIVIFSFLIVFLMNSFPTFKDILNSILRVKGLVGTSVLAFPLAFSLGNIINAVMLYKMFKADFGVTTSVKKSLFQSLVASLLMGIGIYLSLNVFDNVFNIDTVPGIFLQGFCSVVAGGLIWFLVLYQFKNDQIKEVVTSVRQKFWRVKPIAPEAENIG